METGRSERGLSASPPGAPRDGSRPAAGDPPGRWGILTLLAAAELAGMSLWFTASAAAPALRTLWSLSANQEIWLTNAVQLGFVVGTAIAALLNLADIVRARTLFAISAVSAASVNAALLLAPGFGVAVFLRFLTGAFLAGVYPPAMKMAATWFRDGRGLAIGTIVGALTIGKATPYLLGSFDASGLAVVIGGASASALLAAGLVVVSYRDGPFSFPSRPFQWGLVGVVLRHPETRLAILGYLGHMWELYAMWALITAFFGAAFGGSGAVGAGLLGFLVIAAGGPGSVLAGRYADRFGRERIAAMALLVSGACALSIGWLGGVHPGILVGVAVIWGFSVVADSAQFSALVTEVAPGHAVGTALTVQTSLGFALTVPSIWLASRLADVASWGVAFGVLAAGPLVGILAMARLARRRGS